MCLLCECLCVRGRKKKEMKREMKRKREKSEGRPRLCAFCVPMILREYTGCVCAALERGLTITGALFALRDEEVREEKAVFLYLFSFPSPDVLYTHTHTPIHTNTHANTHAWATHLF